MMMKPATRQAHFHRRRLVAFVAPMALIPGEAFTAAAMVADEHLGALTFAGKESHSGSVR